MQSTDLPQRLPSDLGRVFPSGVQIGQTPYGFGVFAAAFIPKGTPIARVSGKIVHDADYSSDYCISAGEDKVLEPAPPFCYLNHCCDPNCQLMQYVRSEEAEDEELEEGELTSGEMDLPDDDTECEDDDAIYSEDDSYEPDALASDTVANATGSYSDDDDPEFDDDHDAEIWVESLKDIMVGDELVIDYAWTADRAMKCLCGSANCRGWIVDPAELHLLTNNE
jgi:hypothetical protein